MNTSKHLPSYSSRSDTYSYAGSQELLPYRTLQGPQWNPVIRAEGNFQVQRFRSKIERSFERFERWTDSATGRCHWLLFGRNGTVSVFGLASDNSTRIADPADPDLRTFQWLLEAQYDRKGNAIVYEYKGEDDAGVDRLLSFETHRLKTAGGFGQRYLKRIRYGNTAPLSYTTPGAPGNEWRFEVVLDYGEHSGVVPTPDNTGTAWAVRADPFSSYKAGFELRTYRLCRRLLMFHRFPELGAAPCLVGSTELTHQEDAAGTVLTEIRYRGYRKDLSNGQTADKATPALRLEYSPPEIGVGFESAAETDNVPAGLDGAAYQWVDLKGEGLPGILHRRNGAWYFKENLGQGRFAAMQCVEEVPAAISVAFQLTDFDQDGDLNFVGFEGREAGSYSRDRVRGRWDAFEPLRSLPRVDFANARVQWVDLNGDGESDLIVDKLDQLAWYPSSERGFEAAVELAKPDVRSGGAPTLTQDRRLQTFFADMNGDGMLDMVRVESGRVVYWPQVGMGEFGEGVVMEGAPVLESFGAVDASRLLFADLDGSGCASLVYVGDGQVRFWLNRWGNSIGPEARLRSSPYIDSSSTFHLIDYLGDGSTCLVWSTPLASTEGRAVQYLRLSGPAPPRLLTSVDNDAGRVSHFTYRSSAEDYLRDKLSETPWRTVLPRHLMVVGALTGIDGVTGTQIMTRYEYRDGVFDPESHASLFGLVDAYDTDMLADGAMPPEEISPPSLVRSWFHTGTAGVESARRSAFYSGDARAARLPGVSLEGLSGLATCEQLAGFRVVEGTPLRQEFYTVRQDGTRDAHPLRTSEFAYQVRCLQPCLTEDDAVFTYVQTELLSYEYEGTPDDPRVSHEIVTAGDTFGTILGRVSTVYPRRPGPQVRAEQLALHSLFTERRITNIDTAGHFELGIDVEEKVYQLTGLTATDSIFTRDEVVQQLAATLANPLAFHETPAGARLDARLVRWKRTLYVDDAGAAAMPLGQAGAVTLLHHVERAVLPEAAVATAYGGRVSAATLSGDCHYVASDGHWWAPDTRYRYGDSAAFFRMREETTPRGGRNVFTLDPHSYMVVATEDVLGNRIESVPDFQALASIRVRDANENVSEALYDPLAAPIVTALHGRQLGTDAQEHPAGADDLANYVSQAGATAAEVLAQPEDFIQGATTFMFYDTEAFARGNGPVRAIHLEREEHFHDGEGTPPSTSRVRVKISYIDGFGRTVQTKLLADPGPAVTRDAAGVLIVDANGQPMLSPVAAPWLSSGHDVYNNKSWPVYTFEPFFSTTPDFETDAALHAYGVALRTRYDSVGRAIREDLPHGVFVTNEYGPWQITRSDACDNIVGSEYEATRATLPTSHPERIALDRARDHALTPTIVELDSYGRPYLLRELGHGVERVTKTEFNATGIPVRIVDPRNIDAFTYAHDMVDRSYFEHSADAGDHWTLLDSQGLAVHRWDGRGVHTTYTYDAESRLVETHVEDGATLDNVVQRATYGDNPVIAQAALRNARGRAIERYDEAGIFRLNRYHVDGQVLETTRALRGGADGYRTTVDWSNAAAVPLDGAQHRTLNRFDGLARLVAHSLPDGTTREYDYARLGHIERVRLTTADGVLNQSVLASSIEVNGRGQRTHLALGNGAEVRYEYDPATFKLQRLHARRAAGVPRDYMDIEYTHDASGNITRWVDHVQDPGAATPLIQGLTTSSACEFTYDAFYQLLVATGRVHQALLEHDYRAGLAAPDAVKGTRHLSLNNGAAIERYARTYTYDLAGNIGRIRHQGVTHNWTTELWTSPSSNRSLPRKDLNGVDIANPEQGFDANGNTVLLPHLRRMDWNYDNLLTRAVVIDRSATGDADDAEYYVYDAHRLRVRRVTERLVAGQLEVTETTYFDGCELRRVSLAGNLRLSRQSSHVADGNARIATLHQWSVDQAARETDNVAEKRIHYLAGNHLGSVSLELDQAGDVISYEEYFPFGGTSFLAGRSIREVSLKEYRYSGKIRDDVTGFYSYEYRYYAPFIGNWLSPDRLGPEGGLNLYCFVENNPIRYIDAYGLQPTDRTLAQGPKELTKAEALGFYNQNWAYDRGLVITKLEAIPGETGWWRIPEGGTRPMTADEIQEWERLQAVEQAAELADEIFGDLDLSALDVDFEEAFKDDKDKKEGGGGGGDNEGEGPGAGNEGNGPGGGGPDNSEGTGPGTKAGTGPGPGGTGDQQQGEKKENAAPGKTGGKTEGKEGGKPEGKEGGKPEGKPGGVKGGTGKEQTEKKKDGTPSDTKAPPGPPPPTGMPTGPDGIPYSPDLVLPEVIPESGTIVTDPSQIRQGGGKSDIRGEPGQESGSGTRPGGQAGGKADGSTAEGERGQGADSGLTTGKDGGASYGKASGAVGGVYGGSGWITLPTWLAEPLSAIAYVIDKSLDAIQVVLDVIGLIPGLGEIADGINGLISLARGDYVGAGLSFAAMIPFAGMVATAGKWGKRGINAVDALSDTAKAVTKNGDEAASVVNTTLKGTDDVAQVATKNADEAAQGTAKAADDPSFKGVIDADEFANDPAVIDRLSRAKELDIGGYHQLTSKGEVGKVGDGLDSDEVIQNVFGREKLGVDRAAAALKENPAIALTKPNHSKIKNLKADDLPGRSAHDVMKYHLDQMKDFVPDFVRHTLEREGNAFIKKMGW